MPASRKSRQVVFRKSAETINSRRFETRCARLHVAGRLVSLVRHARIRDSGPRASTLRAESASFRIMGFFRSWPVVSAHLWPHGTSAETRAPGGGRTAYSCVMQRIMVGRITLLVAIALVLPFFPARVSAQQKYVGLSLCSAELNRLVLDSAYGWMVASMLMWTIGRCRGPEWV